MNEYYIDFQNKNLTKQDFENKQDLILIDQARNHIKQNNQEFNQKLEQKYTQEKNQQNLENYPVKQIQEPLKDHQPDNNSSTEKQDKLKQLKQLKEEKQKVIQERKLHQTQQELQAKKTQKSKRRY